MSIPSFSFSNVTFPFVLAAIEAADAAETGDETDPVLSRAALHLPVVQVLELETYRQRCWMYDDAS